MVSDIFRQLIGLSYNGLDIQTAIKQLLYQQLTCRAACPNYKDSHDLPPYLFVLFSSTLFGFGFYSSSWLKQMKSGCFGL